MATLSLGKNSDKHSEPRKWGVIFRIVGAEEMETGVRDVMAPDAWVKGGHLFLGDARQQEWIAAWAPGGWLSVELLTPDDNRAGYSAALSPSDDLSK